MCWWGVAYVLGPNINAPMSPEAGAQAWEALGRAHALAPKVSAKEQDYITALSARYVEAPTEDRTALNEAYAEAMKQLAAKYPDDVDATILAVEALMDLHPWNFYEFKTGEARPWTPEILALLEGALEAAPDHQMANHLYIHLVEASHEPERALPSAARLPKSAPGAGHLVHMPAHVYIRVGQYNEASKANQAAVEADQDYITQCRAQGIYPLA
jgi:predicted Zn-dependent protease